MNWREIISRADAYLNEKKVPDSQVAAELLAARLLGCGRGFLSASFEKDVPDR